MNLKFDYAKINSKTNVNSENIKFSYVPELRRETLKKIKLTNPTVDFNTTIKCLRTKQNIITNGHI